jgi:5-hydroxyisourate hydrolase
MSPFTTHVLDTATGKPARGLAVSLEIASGPDSDRRWIELGRGVTDDEGRIRQFEPPLAALQPEVYRFRFDTGAYFTAMGVHAFYPVVHIIVRIDDPIQHFHIPLLLSPFGYTTYRGS